MGHLKRSLALLVAAAATGLSLVVIAPAAQAVQTPQDRVVSAIPGENSPNIQDGAVHSIAEVGTKVILGGNFTKVANRATGSPIVTRNRILAYTRTTGVLDTSFVPAVNGNVEAIVPGPAANTAFIVGTFSTVNGTARKSVALLNTTNGALVPGFVPAVVNGAVNDAVLRGNRLYLGGSFTKVANQNHAGLAALNATTGAVDNFVQTQIAGHHNWAGSGAKGAVQVDSFDITPDASRLIMIGNFKTVNGLPRDQIAMLDLTGASAVVKADWNTLGYTPACASGAFDSYMRDVDASPDGTYFAVVATGAHFGGTLCDTATRWQFSDVGSDVQPRWIDDAGGDTLLSVAITGTAIYVGGHQRWMNNPNGADSAGAGAVGRAGIAALDPVSGLPFSWNPGRNPRGAGAGALYATANGLYVGSDTAWIGNNKYKRGKIAFFPLAGGAVPPSSATPQLPAKAYQSTQSNFLYRINAGGPTVNATDGGPAWQADDSDDSGFRNSGSSTAGFDPVGSVDGTVAAGAPAAIFTDERWDAGDDPEMHWGFPVPAGTSITVRLYLANRYDGTAGVGQRVFDVALDGTTVLDDYDIVADVGHNVGTMKSYSITSDGTVDLDFGHVVENPLVDAIEIVRNGPPADPTALTVRTYNGTTAGPATPVGNPDGTNWSSTRGAFLVGGTLFYGRTDQTFVKRSFNGTAFGVPAAVDPYHDPLWDNVGTGTAGQTYRGVTVGYYAELPAVTGAFYSATGTTAGRMYYSLAGQSGLYWRWFNPENGVVGGDRFEVSGATGFAGTSGLFLSGTDLYRIDQATGNLSRIDFTGGAVGPAVLVSGPGVDGVDWRPGLVFLGPA